MSIYSSSNTQLVVETIAFYAPHVDMCLLLSDGSTEVNFLTEIVDIICLFLKKNHVLRGHTILLSIAI